MQRSTPSSGPARRCSVLAALLVAIGCQASTEWLEEPGYGDPREIGQPGPAGADEPEVGVEPAGPSEPVMLDSEPVVAAAPRLSLGAGEAEPVEVFVLPVRDESGAFAAPLGILRDALQRGLVDHRYTPIAFAYGDERMSAAADAGRTSPTDVAEALAVDALFQLRLVEWNTEQLESRGLLRADVEGTLVRGADPQGLPLWSLRLARAIELPARSLRSSTRAELEAECARRVVEELFLRLPARDPGTGTAETIPKG